MYRGDVYPLSFNLAQFNSVDQLTEAFHKVQDRALSSEEVPLVIFDEFDSYFEGQLGWLKFFLAPMQDGLFRGKTGDYRVGRAIFLFSGGTCDTFIEFCKGSESRTEKEDLRKVKLTDFIARLRGHLNVTDINLPDDLSSTRNVRIVKLRRAILSRSLLELHAKPILSAVDAGGGQKATIANIQDEVIKMFLDTPKYAYGVRSMEAIIQMSRWIEGHFVAASLPSKPLLNSHVAVDSTVKTGFSLL